MEYQFLNCACARIFLLVGSALPSNTFQVEYENGNENILSKLFLEIKDKL